MNFESENKLWWDELDMHMVKRGLCVGLAVYMILGRVLCVGLAVHNMTIGWVLWAGQWFI